jgi:diphosphomevalonate decarboxylase
MKRVSAKACSNVALLKYWGRTDNKLRLPANNSISVNLTNLISQTSIEEADGDEVIIDNQIQKGKAKERVVKFLDLAGGKGRVKCKVVSKNSFPKSTGMSSSASGFAALAGAVNKFFKLGLDERELSILARKGSGSACRSVPGGWVRWNAGSGDKSSLAETIFPKDHWELVILAVVVSDKVKEVATSKGHELAQTSPYFKARLAIINSREKEMIRAIEKKDFDFLGELGEREMFEFHAIVMTQKPGLFYWYPGTVEVVHKMRQMRRKGTKVFCTINTGHNVFVFCLPRYKKAVLAELKKLGCVQEVIENQVGGGVKIVI